MSLTSLAGSSTPRRPKVFAIRSFPDLCGPATTAEPPPAAAGNIKDDQKDLTSHLVAPRREPNSCGPESEFLSYGGRIFKPPKVFAIRSFPDLCGPATTAEPPPAAAGNIKDDQKDLMSPLVAPHREPNSCGLESEFLSYGGRIFKPPIAFARRKFPKGCGPLTVCIPKPSDEASIGDDKDSEKSDRKSSQITKRSEPVIGVEVMEQKLNDVVRGIHEERRCSGNSLENDLVGKSLGGNDGEKADRKRSVLPDFVRDGKGFCRAEGSESENRIETMEEGLTEVARRTSKKSVVEKSLGEKDGEKPDRKSSLSPDFVKDGESFYSPERSESKEVVEDTKEKLNNAVRKISKEGDGSGKILVDDVGGRPLGEKDGKKPNKKRSLMPDLAAKVGSEGGQKFEVRGDRLIVLALMAAERCPWMQGKRKGSVGLQSRQKKPRSG